MHSSGSGAAESHSQSVLLSFKPRQVLLAQTNTNTRKMMKKDQTLNPVQSSLLLSSVLCYLDNKSFSKPLKYLISAAQIQDESWKTCSLNLEDIFKHYMETCLNANAKLDTSKEKELLCNGTKKDGDDHSSGEAVVKKKKKKVDDNSERVVAVAEEVELKTKKKTKKSSDLVEETEQATELATKEHKNKKKKSKHNPEPVESHVDSQEEVKSEDKKKKSEPNAKSGCDGEADPDAEVKSKDKKKKKKKQISDLGVEMADKADGKETVLSNDTAKEKDDSASGKLSGAEVANEGGVEKEKKESKKRKRSESVENDTGITNGNDEVKGRETTGNKSRKKDNNGSTEPKTVIAFQRVKIDDVKFADERLQDNSYWAKDGADVGYGAKAQEVLGQVRGRDFRHEKTKKKRGSYRGGQIDLHSHSVKFNYDDDEEE